MARGRPSKKQLILDIAQQLFSERGYQGTSIDLVVRLAQVSKPTVYNNFPSKQVLLQTLIESQLEVIKERHLALLEADTAINLALYQVFSEIIDNEFEVAIFRIFYGERYKLEQDCFSLCQRLDQQAEETFMQILAPLNLTTAQFTAILAIYKNALLIGHLQEKDQVSESSLKEQLDALVGI